MRQRWSTKFTGARTCSTILSSSALLRKNQQSYYRTVFHCNLTDLSYQWPRIMKQLRSFHDVVCLLIFAQWTTIRRKTVKQTEERSLLILCKASVSSGNIVYFLQLLARTGYENILFHYKNHLTDDSTGVDCNNIISL